MSIINIQSAERPAVSAILHVVLPLRLKQLTQEMAARAYLKARASSFP